MRRRRQIHGTRRRLGVVPYTLVAAVVLAFGAAAFAGCGSNNTEDGPTVVGDATGGGPDGGNGVCEDECDTEGTRVCTDDKTVKRCQAGPDGCLDLVLDVECPSYKVCSAGTCIEENTNCSDRCAQGEPPQCNQNDEVIECDDHDGDGCFEWGNPTSCGSGKTCDDATGTCKDVECSNNCSAGETKCEGDLVRRCERTENDCLEYSAAESCGEGKVCESGSCVEQTGCEDECDGAICASGGGIRRCSDTDGDGCNELESSETCPSGKSCEQGSCVSTSSCDDQCPKGEEICVNNGVATCADHDGDGCVEFNSPQSCSGDKDCVQTSPGEAECKTPQTSNKIVINEFLHDPLGQDVRGSGSSATSPTFIELAGPGGASIANYKIELINGANGSTYATFTLPSGAELDSTGYAVVSMQNPNSYFTQTAPSLTNVYKLMTPYQSGHDALQNGPDNIVLKDDSGTTVDAVGYGNFSSGDTFEGEGSAVPQTASGRSLGRDEKADSDDNSSDFQSYYPTPGLENSDLLINEVYPNQPGFDDKTKTFVEIAAPIPNWEDFVLDGYVLHAINGYNGKDYIPTGAKGVKLLGHKLHESPTDEGYFVVCNKDAASPPTGPPCNVKYDGVDWQNGPDNVVLRYNGRKVDAIGYGSFSSSDVFVGEGTEVSYSSSDAGQSLSRWPLPNEFFDFDSNLLDFWKVEPTPGTTNKQP